MFYWSVWARIAAVCFCTAAACAAEGEWEAGAVAGYGFYRDATVFAPAGRARAGIRDRFAAGAVLAENMYEHLSGEVRYTYQDGDPFIAARGVRLNVQGQSHTFHYDVLVHLRGRRHMLRPYVSAGAGAKLYRVSGPPLMEQPLGDIAVLTTRDDWRPVVALGGGVKLRAHRRLVVSFDFRHFITPFPSRLIEPAPFATPRGLFQQFTPMVGMSYSF